MSSKRDQLLQKVKEEVLKIFTSECSQEKLLYYIQPEVVNRVNGLGLLS